MYLIFSSITNIVLDLIFVAVFHFGVGAAALATIISQFLSALLCFLHLLKGPKEYRIYLSQTAYQSFDAEANHFQWSASRSTEFDYFSG